MCWYYKLESKYQICWGINYKCIHYNKQFVVSVQLKQRTNTPDHSPAQNIICPKHSSYGRIKGSDVNPNPFLITYSWKHTECMWLPGFDPRCQTERGIPHQPRLASQGYSKRENVGAVSTVTTDVPSLTCCSVHCWQACHSLASASLQSVALSHADTHTHTSLLHRRALVVASANVLHVVLCVYNSV